jgi:hypothetical protein
MGVRVGFKPQPGLKRRKRLILAPDGVVEREVAQGV